MALGDGSNGRLQQYLLYLLTLVVAMLGWFSVTTYNKAERVEGIQRERKRSVEEVIPRLEEKVEALRITVNTMTATEATLRRHEEALRRLDDWRMQQMGSRQWRGIPLE